MTQLCATIADVKVLDAYCLELTFSDGLRASGELVPRAESETLVF